MKYKSLKSTCSLFPILDVNKLIIKYPKKLHVIQILMKTIVFEGLLGGLTFTYGAIPI